MLHNTLISDALNQCSFCRLRAIEREHRRENGSRDAVEEFCQGNEESWVLSGRICEAEKKLEGNEVLIVERECILQGMGSKSSKRAGDG